MDSAVSDTLSQNDTISATNTRANPSSENEGYFETIQTIRHNTPAIITNNAPRIVAALKIAGSACMIIFSKSKVFKAAGTGFIAANSVMALFGGKKTEEEKERLRQEEEAKGEQTGFEQFTSKLFQPHKYPIESATSIAMGSSVLWTLSGILAEEKSFARFGGGALSLASDTNVIFTKERIGEAVINPHEKGTLDYYKTELKNRPVLLSSALNIGCDLHSIGMGAYEWKFKGKDPAAMLAGSFLLAANAFQAVYVDKNDYNIEESNTPKTADLEDVQPEGHVEAALSPLTKHA